MTTPTTAALASSDGRRERSAKTRAAIADALLDLLGDGHLRPTAKEIAERAGVSVRTVYVHFDDLEDLFCVAVRQQYARVAPLLEPVTLDGSLHTRVVALVERRIRLYARIGAVGLATRLQAPFSPMLARVVRDAHARSRAELERVFAPELDALTAAHRATTLAVLDVLTGPETWQTLRNTDDLARDDAAAAVVAAILAQLAAAR